MFKYLWIVVISVLYLWWLIKAMQGLVEEIKFAKTTPHKRIKFDCLPYATSWYIFIHAIAILAWSIAEFLFYYS